MGLGLIRAWDVTKVTRYLDAAESIFRDMAGGGDNTCGGGIWWSKDRNYKNAIANELYLAVAASLANRVSSADSRTRYRNTATQQWAWFRASGMINGDNTINDGLYLQNCTNNGGIVWSYNQGVVLGGLVELNKANGDASLLQQASAIANAAINRLSQPDGILHDPCEPNCGSDGPQFKVRHANCPSPLRPPPLCSASLAS